MVLFEVNLPPATPLDKSQPLASISHEWGEENYSLIPGPERSPHGI